MSVHVRSYKPTDETGWLRCRVLAFLDTAYFDNVYTRKEGYANPAIELVAAVDGHIVGLLDIEYEQKRGSVAFACDDDPRNDLGAVIHHIAVHPDYRRQGIGARLLETALRELKRAGIGFLEAWTRDDHAARSWYDSQGFRSIYSYVHVYVDGPSETRGTIRSDMPKLYPCFTFAHYIGADRATIQQRFKRVHECRLYRRSL